MSNLPNMAKPAALPVAPQKARLGSEPVRADVKRIKDVTCPPAGRPDRETQPKLVSRKIGQIEKEGNRHEALGNRKTGGEEGNSQ